MRYYHESFEDDPLTREIIGGAIEVHRFLGPGAFESTCETCLVVELELRGLEVQRQVVLPLRYKGVEIAAAYRMDLVVNGSVIVEVKAVDHVHPVHMAQLLTYMKLSGIPVGLLCNFHVELMKDGIRRFRL